METEEKTPRKRSLTSVTLQWLAERMRKAERIKRELEDGTYSVSTERVAASLVNADGEEKSK